MLLSVHTIISLLQRCVVPHAQYVLGLSNVTAQLCCTGGGLQHRWVLQPKSMKSLLPTVTPEMHSVHTKTFSVLHLSPTCCPFLTSVTAASSLPVTAHLSPCCPFLSNVTEEVCSNLYPSSPCCPFLSTIIAKTCSDLYPSTPCCPFLLNVTAEMCSNLSTHHHFADLFCQMLE